MYNLIRRIARALILTKLVLSTPIEASRMSLPLDIALRASIPSTVSEEETQNLGG